jgi:hypothetical protein
MGKNLAQCAGALGSLDSALTKWAEVHNPLFAGGDQAAPNTSKWLNAAAMRCAVPRFLERGNSKLEKETGSTVFLRFGTPSRKPPCFN